ncbi:MAG TPA: DUF6458 family protein [Actinopolymorphaceae bacterium]
MSLGSGIFLVALGAILAFAVRRDLGWLDIQVVGGVLIVTGIVVLVMTFAVWNKRRRGGTVTQSRELHDGQPTTVHERRVYHDSTTPPPA